MKLQVELDAEFGSGGDAAPGAGCQLIVFDILELAEVGRVARELHARRRERAQADAVADGEARRVATLVGHEGAGESARLLLRRAAFAFGRDGAELCHRLRVTLLDGVGGLVCEQAPHLAAGQRLAPRAEMDVLTVGKCVSTV